MYAIAQNIVWKLKWEINCSNMFLLFISKQSVFLHRHSFPFSYKIFIIMWKEFCFDIYTQQNVEKKRQWKVYFIQLYNTCMSDIWCCVWLLLLLCLCLLLLCCVSVVVVSDHCCCCCDREDLVEPLETTARWWREWAPWRRKTEIWKRVGHWMNQ